MKTFLLVTSQLPADMLRECTYQPVDNPGLAYKPTRFPAIPLINAHVGDGDAIRVVTVTYDIPACHQNLALLKKELSEVCEAHHVSCEVDSIEVPFSDSIKAILNVYQQLIERIGDGDELYADITYGSKPMPIVLTMALQYAYRTKENVSIECVTYGQISHHMETRDAKIYDVTALVQLDEIVRLMADGNVTDPAGVIRRIIDE